LIISSAVTLHRAAGKIDSHPQRLDRSKQARSIKLIEARAINADDNG
jgi:hypothetical protein